MHKDELINEYFDYLCDVFKLRLPKYRKYRKLLARLFETQYFWIIPMDENRAIDAISLRKEFLFDSGYSTKIDLWEDCVNVLEVLLSFSRRIEIEIMGTPGDDHLERWFWVMLNNLGLLGSGIYDDKSKIDKILEIWMSRKFSKNGQGNIFLTHKTDTDLREVEFWWQMQRYMSEFYGD